MKMLLKICGLLAPRDKKQAFGLFVMMLFMAFLDVLGVASIMPFMSVVADQSMIERNTTLAALYRWSGVENVDVFLLLIGVAVFVLLLLSLAFKAITAYIQTRFGLMQEYQIGKRLVELYLHQPYDWFLGLNSADLGKTVLSELNTVIHFAVLPSMILVAQSVVTIAMLALLLWVDLRLALGVGTVLVVCYVGIYKLSSKILKRHGEGAAIANQERFIVINEMFGAIKEVKVSRLETMYVDAFSVPAKKYAEHQAAAQVLGQVPRFALEAVAFGGMILLVLFLIINRGGFASAMPVVALYALAAYRLMPALQQIYFAASQIRFSTSSVNKIYNDLELDVCAKGVGVAKEAINFNSEIMLKSISYSYPGSQRVAVNNFEMIIPVRTTIGLVGTTGSGKSTTVDIIMGLLKPSLGSLFVDGITIDDQNIGSWQALIGYVPQQIYLIDDSVAANIAFGVKFEEINFESVENAARVANLHDFIVNELPHGYETKVGERGVRLSGGQRQRIGIARALYSNPQVLILDEATSALDNLTEQAVIDAVMNLGHKVTIIQIAHRLSTVKHCDVIYLLENGRINDAGTFEELVKRNGKFKKMAAA